MKKRNRKSFGKVINWQHTHTKEDSRKKYTGESSPYWDWVAAGSERKNEGEFVEGPQADPDVLAYNENYQAERDKYQSILETGFALLSPREKEVFQLLCKGATEVVIAQILSISRSSVHNHRIRIKNKFTKAVDIEA